ncbi:trafficking protein particle complex subunit 2-like protein [Anaeramoeba flamelloides]|uniref:Trafficking protein particle complex subunit 2-like protein n=1 Tax=Anaeramoeba flamelloides TaxID=1746091 RepID=A0AAV7ZFY1_9EUKA|nr:trafficking protein particle complex subunit 2-like protein [Anaeramoeba flamelloides]KAJ6248051.1 trafficking protein particle complex subunit 2-like protein [Anaeramoeba flamelloides]
MIVVSLAIVGQKNNPLYIYCSEPENKRKFEYIIHRSLDFFEEKVNSNSSKETKSQQSLFLGLLFPTETYRVFGYITNTNYKLICILNDLTSKNEEVSKLLRSFHHLLIQALCNPFYITDEPIDSEKFHNGVLEKILN